MNARLVLARYRLRRCGWCDYQFRDLDRRFYVRERDGGVLCERCAVMAPREIVLYWLNFARGVVSPATKGADE